MQKIFTRENWSMIGSDAPGCEIGSDWRHKPIEIGSVVQWLPLIWYDPIWIKVPKYIFQIRKSQLIEKWRTKVLEKKNMATQLWDYQIDPIALNGPHSTLNNSWCIRTWQILWKNNTSLITSAKFPAITLAWKSLGETNGKLTHLLLSKAGSWRSSSIVRSPISPAWGGGRRQVCLNS